MKNLIVLVLTTLALAACADSPATSKTSADERAVVLTPRSLQVQEGYTEANTVGAVENNLESFLTTYAPHKKIAVRGVLTTSVDPDSFYQERQKYHLTDLTANGLPVPDVYASDVCEAGKRAALEISKVLQADQS